jgi:hypothetical protein
MNANIIPSTQHIACGEHLERTARECSLCSDTGESRISDTVVKCPGEIILGRVMPGK